MNKAKLNKIKTNKLLKIEIQNVSWNSYALLLAFALVIAIFFPGFFHLVGVEQVEIKFPFVFDLSLSISSAIGVCICSIVIGVLYSNHILPSFLEETRLYTYLLPGGRKLLFLIKTWILWFLSFIIVFIGFVIPFIGYYLFLGYERLVSMIVYAIVSALFIAGISSSVGVISGLIGIIKNSSVITVLSSVILGALLANSFANSGVGIWSVLIELILFLCMLAISICGILFTKRHILTEDVF